MKKIEIFCTLGPSSLNKSFLKFAEKNKSRAVLILPPFYYKNVYDEGIINYFTIITEIFKVPMSKKSVLKCT